MSFRPLAAIRVLPPLSAVAGTVLPPEGCIRLLREARIAAMEGAADKQTTTSRLS